MSVPLRRRIANVPQKGRGGPQAGVDAGDTPGREREPDVRGSWARNRSRAEPLYERVACPTKRSDIEDPSPGPLVEGCPLDPATANGDGLEGDVEARELRTGRKPSLGGPLYAPHLFGPDGLPR